MRRIKFAVALLFLIAAMSALTACGDDDDSTTTVQTATAPSTGTTSGGVETTPGGAVVPAAPDCGQGQIYSQGEGACVAEGHGENPCPAGEVPEADQPVCVPKD